MMRALRTAVCVLLAVAGARQAPAGDASLAVVLQRAGVYVTDFHRTLSRIIAEERYVQHWEILWDGPHKRSNDLGERRLVSDLMLVKPKGAADWLQYRDTFEVDGKPVRVRQERLSALLADRSKSAADQVERIREESARYNLGDIDRNVNTPMLAMRFLEPENQSRFHFKRTTDRAALNLHLAPDTDGVFRVAAEVWTIEYDETERPTIIRTRNNKDLPAHGRFWIDPDNGHVLMSELSAGNRAVRGTIDVSYQSEPLVGMLVPIEMREDYQDKAGSHITGVATYGRFRRVED
jgi:hypothetical protein